MRRKQQQKSGGMKGVTREEEEEVCKWVGEREPGGEGGGRRHRSLDAKAKVRIHKAQRRRTTYKSSTVIES